MVEMKNILIGKVNSIGKKTFKNDNDETITHYINFIDNDDEGNIDIIKVKILDEINDKKVNELREQYTGKTVEIEYKQFLICNNNRVNKYLSCELKNIREV